MHMEKLYLERMSELMYEQTAWRTGCHPVGRSTNIPSMYHANGYFVDKITFFLKNIKFFGSRKTGHVPVHDHGACLLWMKKKSTVYLFIL